ncbi:hypothetical protein SAMN05661080_01086 [Modestobacter sp. DSM 44400]|uniref:hypothetical protein n=1 Tax=Modestobacter sp. DSM 44400 TaxID=1550230 RepID=UPI000894CF60|nr:hypothetical protein [Modestobacter sp. DSM 44400]SDX75874.1 hypothetical protein SAMN05661080_01086 [Modestobacter sp. DSM 44400]
MSRPIPALTDAAAQARAELAEDAHAGFDRLVHALLPSPSRQPALGAALRGQLPGTAGVRWLHAEGLAPTARAADLTTAQWLSLHTAWLTHDQAPRGGNRPAGRTGRADSRHGHAPGAQAAPRWF